MDTPAPVVGSGIRRKKLKRKSPKAPGTGIEKGQDQTAPLLTITTAKRRKNGVRGPTLEEGSVHGPVVKRELRDESTNESGAMTTMIKGIGAESGGDPGPVTESDFIQGPALENISEQSLGTDGFTPRRGMLA